MKLEQSHLRTRLLIDSHPNHHPEKPVEVFVKEFSPEGNFVLLVYSHGENWENTDKIKVLSVLKDKPKIYRPLDSKEYIPHPNSSDKAWDFKPMQPYYPQAWWGIVPPDGWWPYNKNPHVTWCGSTPTTTNECKVSTEFEKQPFNTTTEYAAKV